MTRPTRAWRTAVVLATASLALTACGSDSTTEDPASEDSSSSAPSSSAPAAKGDGTLTIGTLLPQTGDLAFLGPPEFAGVEAALNDINAAGGVLGKDAVQVKADSGDGTPDIAGAQTDKLLDANADVVLGAASSSVSLSVIDKITGAGVVHFSPANTSTVLDDPKTDPKNLYFRTAPSDVLQGAVLSNLIIEDGKNNVAILARQDSYGEALARETEKGIKSGGGNVVSKQLYSADATNFTAEVNKVAASKPDAIVLISFDETKKLIPQLIAKNVGPQDVQTYFVDGNTADYADDFPKGTLKGVKATYPGAELTADFKSVMVKTDPKLKEFTYGPESYDATMLSALAAIEAKTDDPTTFAPNIITVSAGGTECSTFKDCAALLQKGEDIDYQGVSGPCDLGETGSPTKATIGIFQYEAGGAFPKSLNFVTGVI
ncbi:MAG TPA: ABC transporter substrate-binding protein [Nocardioidaceae bacterium]|nr:ABC transporter substrate-binding protein [Nocardioidaceae bacterium]